MQIITGFRLLSHDRYIPLVYICTRMRMHLTVEYGYTIFGIMGPEDPGKQDTGQSTLLEVAPFEPGLL